MDGAFSKSISVGIDAAGEMLEQNKVRLQAQSIRILPSKKELVLWIASRQRKCLTLDHIQAWIRRSVLFSSIMSLRSQLGL